MRRRMSLTDERQAWAHFVETGERELPKHNKFNAIKTEANGRVYDSGQESKRALDLQWQVEFGEITDLQYQVRFELVPKQHGEAAVFYYADFVYKNKDGKTVVEDSKGHRTAEYRIKKKLMLYVHGIRILETNKPSEPQPRRRRQRR